MAIPPRRWAGYTLITAGLLLLYDTYTFLQTDWSPLHIPMSVPAEVVLGFALALGGICLLVAHILLGVVSCVSPDASMKMGLGLAHDSVELRRQRRLPLKSKFLAIPNRGLIGGTVMLLLLVPMFLMLPHEESKGIYVRLAPRPDQVLDENCLAGPVVVAIGQRNGALRLMVNGMEIGREDLGPTLRAKLATRANWEVFVEGEDSVPLYDPMYAIDVINTVHARAVILTPKLKEQLAERCPLQYSSEP